MHPAGAPGWLHSMAWKRSAAEKRKRADMLEGGGREKASGREGRISWTGAKIFWKRRRADNELQGVYKLLDGKEEGQGHRMQSML